MAGADESSSSSGWTGKNLEEMLQHLNLKDEELDDVVVGEAEVKKLEADARWLAIGRLNTSRPFSSSAMFLKSVWGLAQVPKYTEADNNLFVFQMFCLRDWKKIVHGGPLLFRGMGLIVEDYDGKKDPTSVDLDGLYVRAQIHGIPDMYHDADIVDQLTRRIGRVKEIQLSPRLFYEGDYVRVRARVLVGKPLTRITSWTVTGEGRRILAVKYEKIPYFCQICGFMGHNHEECGDGVWEAKQKQWGSWMLAQRKEVAPGMQGEGHAARGGRSRGRGRAGRSGRGEPTPRQRSPPRKRSSQDAGLDAGEDEDEDVTSPLKSNESGEIVKETESAARRSLKLVLSTSTSMQDQQNHKVKVASSSNLNLVLTKENIAGGMTTIGSQPSDTPPPLPAREKWLTGETDPSNTVQQEGNWKKLWGVQVPAKLRIFAWRLAWASLLTGQERQRRHMSEEAVCPICQAACDTWRHALLDCNMSKSVWSLRDDDDDWLLLVYGDETSDPKIWLHGLCNTLSQDKFVAVLTILWAIWWARRKAIHEQEFQSPLSTHLFIERYVQELRELSAKKQKIKNTRGAASISAPRWILPSPGETKLNDDVAVAKSSNIGVVGVICRNAEGHFLGACALVFHGITEPATLEAYACREAIALAEDMVITKVRIASDCLRVINDLKSQLHRGEYCMILNDIQERKSSFLSCEFVHEQRASNSEAHNLARMVTTLDIGHHLWFNSPPDNLCIPQNIMI
ncbi:hypothetical protein D1007_43385 [Hordeum vulgare]|nr:hypothetical protein D1007_43385 [Hordeum vulgare]